MFALKLNCVLLVLIFHGSDCQRRITHGSPVELGRKYVVYFVKASISPQDYEGWLCGGAIVAPKFIVTSAACVTDVKHLYAIAGYNKYVKNDDIYSDPCTKERKKKIITICTPKAYELKYEEVQKWTYIDIAVVEVESAYDFSDESYTTHCTYIPGEIIINYETKYQEPGNDAIVFGWGHAEKWREAEDLEDHNQEMLHYVPTLIQNKEDCKKEYEVYPGMDEIIDKYMICTYDKGNIDDTGLAIITSKPTAQGCSIPNTKLKGYADASCENPDHPGEEIVLIENSRKNREHTNATIKNVDQTPNYQYNEINSNVVDSNITHDSSLINKMNKNTLRTRQLRTRRNGICQNDHGGPLVTWVGSHEVLIGVASAFKITDDRDCIGPYLFASTQCNGFFLDCILQDDASNIDPQRRAMCDNPEEMGFQLIHTPISWKDHPDGPADNEKNTTIVKSTTNTTSNATMNLMNSNEKKKEKLNFVNTNITNFITNTTTTHLYVNTTTTHLYFNTTNTHPYFNTTTTHLKNEHPTRTTRAVNFIDTTTTNLTNYSSPNLANTTFTNLTNIISTNLKSVLSVILTSATSTNIINETSTNSTYATSTNSTNATSTNSINATSTNSTNATSTNLPNTLITNLKNTITTIIMKAATANLMNTTTTKQIPQ